jgi:hypothetical protein
MLVSTPSMCGVCRKLVFLAKAHTARLDMTVSEQALDVLALSQCALVWIWG